MRERKAVPDQPTRLLDADLLEVFVGRQPERGAEHPNEVKRAESRLAGKQASFRRTFAEAGTYPYFCERHPNMIGEVFVR